MENNTCNDNGEHIKVKALIRHGHFSTRSSVSAFCRMKSSHVCNIRELSGKMVELQKKKKSKSLMLVGMILTTYLKTEESEQ